MDFLRELVSKEKTRYISPDYNLDLTYITPRIIAMAYPALGLESMFRNKITDVSKFFKQKHEKNYKIINCSSRLYDYKYFENRVIDMKWPNHYPCPFIVFIKIILEVINFLMEKKENIVAVHCLAGKGRTGSLVNCVLYVSGKFKSILDANNYYLCKRAVNVTHASQIRYLRYFMDFYNDFGKVDFGCKFISKVIIRTGVEEFFEDDYRLEIFDFERDSKKLGRIDVIKEEVREEHGVFFWERELENWESPESTEILCNLRQKGIIKNSKIFRMNFSTFFVKDKFCFGVEDVDSLSGDLPPDLKIIFEFKTFENKKVSDEWRKSVLETHESFMVLKKKLNEINSSKEHYFYF